MQSSTKIHIRKSLILITATAFLMSIGLLGYYVSRYSEAEKVQRQVLDTAEPVYKTIQGTARLDGVNHAALRAENADYVGWLTVDGTDISYPVVYNPNEDFYLRRDFYGQSSVAGTVFMDSRNNTSFNDTNTMLFGHHMRNGSMFASLKKFLKRDFFEANRFVHINTPERVLLYEIYAVYETAAARVPYYPGMLAEPEWENFSSRVEVLALHRRSISVAREDTVLTLSTCGYRSRNNRILVHAKRIKTIG